MKDRPAIRRPSTPPAAADSAAHAHLRFIRDAMERTSEFTAVPGWGGVMMGITAVIAAFVAQQQPTVVGWMSVWAAEALIGFAIGVWATSFKARKHAVPLLSGQGRKFLLGLLPAVLVGVALTLSVSSLDPQFSRIDTVRVLAEEATMSMRLLPGLWLMLYGAGVIAAGMFSIRLIPMMGSLFMLVGALALIGPVTWGNLFMGIGFGGLHIAFGAYIVQKYGG